MPLFHLPQPRDSSAALPSINLFAAEKNIVIREQASGAYATSAYYLSKLVAELPKLSSKFVFCTLVYWIVGFNPDPVRYLNFLLIVICGAWLREAIGMVMATGLPIGAALAFGPACITVFTLFGGIYLNMDSIPLGAGWIAYVDFIYYAFKRCAPTSLATRSDVHVRRRRRQVPRRRRRRVGAVLVRGHPRGAAGAVPAGADLRSAVPGVRAAGQELEQVHAAENREGSAGPQQATSAEPGGRRAEGGEEVRGGREADYCFARLMIRR